MLLRRDAFPPAIASVGDWLREWPPQMGLKQWQNGKSAKELAKAWFKTSGQPVIPAGLECLLQSSPLTRELTIEAVIGEVKVPLDHGRPRHADLVAVGNVSGMPVLLHVEAKADETFGATCEKAWEKAIRKEGFRSNLPDRMSRLCSLLFGTTDFKRRFENMPEEYRHLRYQLLYATAATILDAARRGIRTAVFIVHELIPADLAKRFLRDDGSPRPLLNVRQIKRNSEDWQSFVVALSRSRLAELPTGRLSEVGEFLPEPTNWLDLADLTFVRLLVGKAVDVTTQQ
jgi:hypothetical protein